MKNEELLNLALETAKNAYAPYSNFFVGAAVEYENGEIYTGCNIENSSYGLALCAERNAISTAIAQGNKSKIKKIAIASQNANKCYPCGACRQWIEEFSADTEILVQNENKVESHTIAELLPCCFNKDYLK